MPKTITTVQQIKDLLKTLNREELIEVEVAARAEMGNHEPSEYDARMIGLASDEHHRDGEIEIDETQTVVSESDDGGAYVMAWVWVYDPECRCGDCGGKMEDGECEICGGA